MSSGAEDSDSVAAAAGKRPPRRGESFVPTAVAVSVCETIEDDLPTQLDRFAKYLHHQEQVWFTLILICLQAS